MDVLEVGFFHVSAIECNIHFHQLVSDRCEIQRVFGRADSHGVDIAEHKVGVLDLLLPYLLMHHFVGVHVALVHLVGPDEASVASDD